MIIINNFKINLKINDFFIEAKGDLKEKVLSFEYENVNYTFNIEECILIRENEEFLSTMDFSKKKENCIYILKELNKTFYYNLITKEFTKQNNKVIINYLMNEEMFKLKLTWEEII